MKLDEVELRSPSFNRFLFLLYVHFYNFTATEIWGIMKLKLMNYPTETEHEAMGQRLSLPVFLFVVIHSKCKHALRKESTIKHSVDELSDNQR